MRIALVVDSFPPYISGVTTHYLALAEELIKNGHSVMIVAPKSNKTTIPKGLEKCKVVFIPSLPAVVAKNMRIGAPSTPKTLLEFAKFKADVIEVSGPTFIGIDAIIASKVLEVPCISYFYTLITSQEYLQLVSFLGKTKAVQKASWLYSKWFYNSTDAVFVPTRGVGKILTRNKINKKIFIAPVFTDIQESKNITDRQKQKIKQMYNLKNNVALYLGRLSKEKNLDNLFLAWQKLIIKFPDSSLLIIGDGKYKGHLTKKAQDLSIQENIVFTGELTHEKIVKSGIIKACDLYVSASTSETFGISALECMINGLPVILVNSQGLCERVDGGGIVCRNDNPESLTNSILRIFSNPRLKEKMGMRAKKVASQFAKEKGYRDIVKLYEKIIKDYESRANHKPSFSNY